MDGLKDKCIAHAGWQVNLGWHENYCKKPLGSSRERQQLL
jgi:hypothetical protein